MSRTKFLIGECEHCGQQLQFPVESVGLTTHCPHCGKQTDLLLAAPPQERTVPVKTIVYTVIAILILVGGLVGAIIAVNRLQRTAEQRGGTPSADAAQSPVRIQSEDHSANAGFRASTVALEKATNSSLVYAIGTIRNETDRRRLRVKVELELLDAAGSKVGTTTDYLQALEPGAEWRFKTRVPVSMAARARIVSITADQ